MTEDIRTAKVAPSSRAAASSTHVNPLSVLAVQVLVLLLWCWAWIPQMIDLVIIGRQSPALRAVARRSETASTTYVAIVAAIIAVAVVLIFFAVITGQYFYASSILLLLIPWVTLNGIYVFSGGRNTEVLLFPLVTVALALNFKCLRNVYTLLRFLVVVTALSSIVLGLTQPHLFLSNPHQQASNDKAIVGDLLLNGLFPTSNQLGVTLALGIPLLITTGANRTRWVGTAIALTATVWASSRTSLAASALVFVVMALAARGGLQAARHVVRPVVIAFAVLTIAVPFIFNDPGGLTGRVAIWRASLDHVVNSDLFFGTGAMTFRAVTPVTASIGAITATGHNIFVTVFTVGGVCAVLALLILWRTYLDRTIESYSVDPYPLIFLLSLSAMAVLEDPLRAFIIAPSSFLIIPVLAMSLVAQENRRRLAKLF